MSLNLLLTYGLPLGSALLTSAFISTTATYETMMSLAESVFRFINSSEEEGKLPKEFVILIKVNFVWRITELLAHTILLWYGTIMKGKKFFLVAWLIFQGFFLSIWEIELICEFAKNTSLWTFSMFLETTFAALYCIFFYGYLMHIGYLCVQRVEPEPVDLSSPSPTFELEPVGKALGKIVEFYNLNSWAGANLAIMMETVLNLCAICKQIQTSFGDVVGNADITENIVVRYSRFFLAIIGFILIQKEKRRLIFIWCMGYLVLLLMSIGIYIFTLFSKWRHISKFAAFNYYTAFSVSLMFRGWVLSACLRFLGFVRMS